MTLSDFYQLAGFALGILGVVAGMGQLLFVQIKGQLKSQNEAIRERLEAIEKSAHDDAQQSARLERELLELKADLPHRYVMRDDYIRGQSIIEAKLDGLASKVENAQLRGFIQGGTIK